MMGDWIMDFFDGWCTFKTTPEGKTIYYPNSFLGKGFVVPNLKKKKGIQRAAKRLYVILLTLFGSFIAGTWIGTRLVPFGWLWYVGIIFIGLTLGATVWFQRSITNLAHGLVESEIKLSLRESYSISVHSLSFTFLLFLEIASGWTVYAGVQMANRHLGLWFVKAFGIGALIFGILLCITTTHMIIRKTKTDISK